MLRACAGPKAAHMQLTVVMLRASAGPKAAHMLDEGITGNQTLKGASAKPTVAERPGAI